MDMTSRGSQFWMQCFGLQCFQNKVNSHNNINIQYGKHVLHSKQNILILLDYADEYYIIGGMCYICEFPDLTTLSQLWQLNLIYKIETFHHKVLYSTFKSQRSFQNFQIIFSIIYCLYFYRVNVKVLLIRQEEN